MNQDTLIRSSVPASLTAAAIGIPADLYHLTIDSRASVAHTALFKAHGLLLVLALALLVVVLAGFALRLGDRLGTWGAVGASAAFLGTLLVLGNVATEAFAMPSAPEALSDPSGYWLTVIIASFGLMAVGWLVLGIAAIRARAASAPAGALLCVGAVISFTPFAGSYVLLLAGVAAAAVSMSRRGAVDRVQVAHSAATGGRA